MAAPSTTLMRVILTVSPVGVARVIAWGLVVALLGVLAVRSPLAPTALSPADVALGHGLPLQAVVLYDQVADHNPWISIRREALRRAARVWAIELGQPRQARRRLETLTKLRLEHDELADTFERIAMLLLEEGQPLEAARVLRQAHDVDPDDPLAGHRLLAAARALVHGGQHREAKRLLRDVAASHPILASAAALERGTQHLALGDAKGALPLFEQAMQSGFDDGVAAVAALGVATCHERLGLQAQPDDGL